MNLDDIIALWRETLAPEAELAAHNAARAVPALTWSANPKALHTEWIARAQAPDAATVVELMRVSDFAKHTANQLLERLERMAEWEPHPIATRWLVDVLARQTRAPLLAGQKCFRRVFGLLVDHVDHAGAARFESWLGTHVERIAASASAAEFFDAGIARVLAKSAKRRAAARALTDEERAALAAAGLLAEPELAPAAVTIESLYAAIYDAPWDDGPRLVLADLLQQQADPRGELIALDLLADPTPDQRERRDELIDKYKKQWFPDELNRIVKKTATYERGFLAFGELQTVDRVAIELATFRELRVARLHNGATPRFDHAAFRGVESWLGVDVPCYGERPERWTQHAPLPRVRRLGVAMRIDLNKPQDLLELIRPAAWPTLAELVIEIELNDSWEYEKPHVPAMFSELPGVLARHLPQLQHVDVWPYARFDRDGRMLTEVSLPSTVARALVEPANHAYQADNRQRWIAWLKARNVPVVVEAKPQKGALAARPEVDALAQKLGVAVRAGTLRPVEPLARRID